MVSESQGSRNSLTGSSAWGHSQAAIKVAARAGVSCEGLTGEGEEESASMLTRLLAQSYFWSVWVAGLSS